MLFEYFNTSKTFLIAFTPSLHLLLLLSVLRRRH
jgi:hypothetical protein